MSSQELTKKCPYNGCDFVSKASSTNALEHNVATHVSNSHRGITTVWFAGTRVTIHRDVKSNSFVCPCGEFSSLNAASVRRHARNLHKKPTTATSATRAPKPAIPSEPKTSDDRMYRVVDPNPKDKLHIGGGEVWVPTGPTVVHKAYPLVAMTPMGPPATNLSFHKRASAFANSSSKASSPLSKSIASTSASPAQPLPARVSTAGPSISRSVPSKRKAEEPTPGPSKVRRVDATRPASASKASASASPSKAVSRASAPRPLFTSAPLKLKSSAAISSSSALTSKKRPADEGLPEPSSSKIRRVSDRSTITDRKAAKLAKALQNVTPLKAPDPATRKVTTTKTRPAGNAPPASTTAATAAAAPAPAKGPPKPRPVVKPGSLAQTQAKPQAASPSKTEPKKQKHVRPAPAAGVAASSASSGFSTSTRGSSSSSLSSARTSATPAASDRAGPSATSGPSRANRSWACSDCGGPIDAWGRDGMCTMCYCESRPAAPLGCVTCGGELPAAGSGTGEAKGGECGECRLRVLPHASSSTSAAPTTKTKTKASAGQQPKTKPPRKRVSRQMRQREFEAWFARWAAVHRARRTHKEKGAGKDAGAGEDRTDWWRVETTRNQGGVCYATPEAFFAALEGAFARQKVDGEGIGEAEGVRVGKEKKRKDKGKGKQKQRRGVLTFYGGYSVVAQPKISAIARLEKVVARMEEIGFRLDGTQQGHVKFKYKSGGGALDEVYKYPCACGGAPPPAAEDEMRHAHRVPDEKHAGEVCGGTIMLMVGEDNALLAYGIQGQHIAVDIVH